MGYASLRSFGGVGFSLDCEPTVVEFESCRTVEIDGTEVLDTRSHLALSELVERLRAVREKVGFRAIIKSVPRQHVGLGSKTSLVMSIIAGANAVNDLGFSNGEMQQLSGRGAASGVGLHAFFQGGIIWDAGHRFVPGMRLSPSSAKPATSVPPLMARLSAKLMWMRGCAMMCIIVEVTVCLNSTTPQSAFQETRREIRHAPPKASGCSDSAGASNRVPKKFHRLPSMAKAV